MPQDLEMPTTNPDDDDYTSDSEASIADVAAVPPTPNMDDPWAGQRKKAGGLQRVRRRRRPLQDLPPDSALRKALSKAPEGEDSG